MGRLNKMNKTSGVYKIINKITGEFYVGSSKNIKQRWYSHRTPAYWQQNPSLRLYQDMSKLGKNNFIIEIIEETDNLREREQYWIDQLKPSYNDRRANGQDTERYKEHSRQSSKEWSKIHRNEKLAYGKAYHQAHRDKVLAYKNASNSRLCLYEGETLTFAALSTRFSRQGIPHPTLEAKKYLI